MHAAIIEAVNQVAVREIPVPELLPDTALVRVAYAGLCGATDACIIEGLHPRATFPVVLGHEFAGHIAQLPAGYDGSLHPEQPVAIFPLRSCGTCATCRRGDSYICEHLRLIGIDCNGGFAEYCRVPLENLCPLPAELPLHVAALTEPFAVAIHAIREAGLRAGDAALILGAGAIGLFTAEACRLAGARQVVVVNRGEQRRALAARLGFATRDNAVKIEGAFDYVFEATGAEALLSPALRAVRIKGTVGILGKFDLAAQVDLHTVLFKEIRMLGFRVYRREEFELAVQLLAQDPSRYEHIITDSYSLAEFTRAYQAYCEGRYTARVMVQVAADDTPLSPLSMAPCSQ
jgi:2-desacetyl-2-hydroxyethyl bacteriochlorophyllide A dehydrogenase